MFDTVSTLGIFDGLTDSFAIVPEYCLEKPFQRELLSRVIGSRRIYRLNSPIRVVDPLVAYTDFTGESISWMREKMGIQTKSGPRKVYIRRQSVTRHLAGGGVSEDEAFIEFLRAYGFETVDFGVGDIGINDQIEMINGADVILSAHGAGLSNIAFLNGDVSLIEITGLKGIWGHYLFISGLLGFKYYGITTENYDAQGALSVNVNYLHEVMARIAESKV